MNEACIMMNVISEVDEHFIFGLKKHFHQITAVERGEGPLNLVIRLNIKNDKEFKDLYNEIHSLFKVYKVKEEMIVVDEI